MTWDEISLPPPPSAVPGAMICTLMTSVVAELAAAAATRDCEEEGSFAAEMI